MDTEWRCLACGRPFDRDLDRRDKKYCDKSCCDSYKYRIKYRKFYADRYQRQKAEWERSVNGKRAGVPISVWRRLPKDWQ